MAKMKCAISGITFSTELFSSLSIPNTDGYIHPIFAVDREKLYPLYTQHCKNELSERESYLLFLAFLHSSRLVEWKAPCSLNPYDKQTTILIESCIQQLISALERTDVIRHPAFTQPTYKVRQDNANLHSVRNYIKSLGQNVDYFYSKRASESEQDEINLVTNKLSYKILSGEHPSKYSAVIADWAAKAADFPPASREHWKKIIRSCFSQTAMFATPLADLKELKDYCECNLEVGSIHFHSLMEVIQAGIHKHVDYLGGSSLALGYTLLDVTPHAEQGGHAFLQAEKKNKDALAKVISNAPTSYPKKEDYASSVDFLRAKLAYRAATMVAVSAASICQGAEADVVVSNKRVVAIEAATSKMSDSIEIDELESLELEDLSDIDGFSVIDTEE